MIEYQSLMEDAGLRITYIVTSQMVLYGGFRDTLRVGPLFFTRALICIYTQRKK